MSSAEISQVQIRQKDHLAESRAIVVARFGGGLLHSNGELVYQSMMVITYRKTIYNGGKKNPGRKDSKMRIVGILNSRVTEEFLKNYFKFLRLCLSYLQ